MSVNVFLIIQLQQHMKFSSGASSFSWPEYWATAAPKHF